MLTLRRRPLEFVDDARSIIDCDFEDMYVTLTLISEDRGVSLWQVDSNCWLGLRYEPKIIALTNNQPLVISDWLTIYGSRKNEFGEVVIHLKAHEKAFINRRDRVINL